MVQTNNPQVILCKQNPVPLEKANSFELSQAFHRNTDPGFRGEDHLFRKAPRMPFPWISVGRIEFTEGRGARGRKIQYTPSTVAYKYISIRTTEARLSTARGLMILFLFIGT